MKLTRLLVFFMLLAFSASGQHRFSGTVQDAQGNPLPGASVHFVELQKGAVSQADGAFLIQNLSSGSHLLRISAVGFQPLEQRVQFPLSGNQPSTYTLEEAVQLLGSVLVVGETEATKLRKQPFSLNVIDARPLQNSNQDVSQVLARSMGINVRQETGLGSALNFSIHGLSGRQVKFFIDGIPMDYFSSALSINNLPINLVERVEVYKGTVPVHLGADALGGAVNIITRTDAPDFLDVSYSAGSFNTHRAAISMQKSLGQHFFVRGEAFYNYSDNNYWVDVEIPDELGNLDGTTNRVRRFHDAYRSAMVSVEGGVRNTRFADELSVRLIASGNRNNVQHGISMNRVFGQLFTTDEVLVPSVSYRKKNLFINGLELNTYTSFIEGHYQVADTSSRTYDWLGNHTVKNNLAIGEARWEKTLFSFNDRTFLNQSNLQYQINQQQHLNLNVVHSRFRRQGEDPLDPNIVPFSDPNYLNKTVAGMSYELKMLEERLSATFFGKFYSYQAKAIEVDWDNTVNTARLDFNKPGYGLAVSYFFRDLLQLKTSFERTWRLPDGFELFGDGLLTLNNAALLPEESYNLNAGLLLHHVSDRHQITAETNFFYRDARNLIRIEASGITSQYVNLAEASSSGVEGDLTWRYSNWLTVGINATYQNIINQTAYDEGRLSSVYQDRIPNIPWFFANLTAGLRKTAVWQEGDALNLQWYSRYVHDFYLNWPSQGDPDRKHVIPEQMLHNLELSYSRQSGRYNISLGSTNLFNAKAYDHFRVQRPGRAFHVKLRYFVQ